MSQLTTSASVKTDVPDMTNQGFKIWSILVKGGAAARPRGTSRRPARSPPVARTEVEGTSAMVDRKPTPGDRRSGLGNVTYLKPHSPHITRHDENTTPATASAGGKGESEADSQVPNAVPKCP